MINSAQHVIISCCICRWRGRLNTIVQLGTISGIVVANAINIGTNKWIAGWRISLGLAAVPGTVLLLGAWPTIHAALHTALHTGLAVTPQAGSATAFCAPPQQGLFCFSTL